MIPPSYTPIADLGLIDSATKLLQDLASRLTRPNIVAKDQRAQLRELHRLVQDQSRVDGLITSLGKVDDTTPLADASKPNANCTVLRVLKEQIAQYLKDDNLKTVMGEGWIEKKVDKYREQLSKFVDLLKTTNTFFATFLKRLKQPEE